MPLQAPGRIVGTAQRPVDVRRLKPFRVERLPRPQRFGGEYGTNGATLAVGDPPTASEDPINFLSLGAGNTITYDTTHAHLGSQSIKVGSLVAGAGGSASFGWRGWRLFNQVCYCRLYFYITAAPSVATQLVRWNRDGNNNLSGGVRITATGTLVAITSSNVTTGTASGALPLNQWIRVEQWIFPDPAVGQLETRAWWTTPDGTGTPDYDATNTGIATGTGMIDGVQFGVGANVTQTADFNVWIDDMAAPFFDWPGPAPAGGPVTNLLTLTASSTPTVLIGNQTGKPIGASEAAAVAMPRQAGKLVFISETASPLLARGAGKQLLASETAAAATTRQTGKQVLVSETATATLARAAAKLLAVIDTPTVLLTRRAGKTLPASETATAAASRQTGKTVGITETATAAITKQTNKLLAVSETASATLGRIKVALLTLAASCTPTALLQRQAGKQLAASETATTAIQRRAGKSLAPSETATTSVSRVTGKLVAISETASATLTRIKSVQLLLTASSAATAAISRQAGKALAAAETATATIQRRAGKTLAATETATTSTGQRIAHAFAVTCTATVTAAKTVNRLLAAASAASVSLATTVQTVATRVVKALYGLVAGIGDTGQPRQTGDTGPLDASTAQFGLLPDPLVYPGTDLFPEPYTQIVFAGAAAGEEQQTGATGIPTSTGASGGVTL